MKYKSETSFTVESMARDLVDGLSPYQEVSVVDATGDGAFDPELEVGRPGRFVIGVDVFGVVADGNEWSWAQEGRMAYNITDEVLPDLDQVQARINAGLDARAAERNRRERLGEPMPF